MNNTETSNSKTFITYDPQKTDIVVFVHLEKIRHLSKDKDFMVHFKQLNYESSLIMNPVMIVYTTIGEAVDKLIDYLSELTDPKYKVKNVIFDCQSNDVIEGETVEKSYIKMIRQQYETTIALQ